MRRKIVSLAVVGVLVAAGAGVAAVTAGHPTANAAGRGATSSNNAAASAATVSLGSAQWGATGSGTADGGVVVGFPGFGPGLKQFGGARLLKVTSVNGNTITATGPFGTKAVTVTVSSSTTYTETGATASLGQIGAGTFISVRGTPSGSGTISATAITIVLPTVTGVVTAINGSTYTVTGLDAAPHTITIDANTQVLRNGAQTQSSNIVVGSAIVAAGTLNSDGSMQAKAVSIVLPRVTGQVTAMNGNTWTVTDVWGTAHTIVTSSSTAYSAPGSSSASASSVSNGTLVSVVGTLESDGKTLDALRVVVQPKPVAAGQFQVQVGPGGRGFFGRHGGRGPGGWMSVTTGQPHVIGQVTAVNGSTLTVSAQGGATRTVVLSSSTTIQAPGTPNATASSITTNSYIVAIGTLASDGKTLDATRVLVLPKPGMMGSASGGFGWQAGGGNFAPAPGAGGQV